MGLTPVLTPVRVSAYSGALSFYFNTAARGNQYMRIIASSSNLGGVVKLAGRGASVLSMGADLLNPNMSGTRKAVSVASNALAIWGGPLAGVGVVGSVTNTFFGEQIESGIQDAADTTANIINGYNNNPNDLINDLYTFGSF